MQPAVALLEFDSIAVGIAAGDAMAKRAPIDTLHAGTVHPGKYLVLVGGQVAAVEEALAAGRQMEGDSLVDFLFLPAVHAEVVRALTGGRRPSPGEALGVIETRTVAATIAAADAGIKGAEVSLLEIRLADGLGGKGYALFGGPVNEVEAAVEIGAGSLRAIDSDTLFHQVVIAQLHDEMLNNLWAAAEFGARVRSTRSET